MQQESGQYDGSGLDCSLQNREARLLDWKAWHCPGEFVTYLEMAEFLLDKEELYLEGEGVTARMRRLVYSLRPVLRKQFNRELVLGKSGARATPVAIGGLLGGVSDLVDSLTHVDRAFLMEFFKQLPQPRVRACSRRDRRAPRGS
jgi:hypothetical protein